MVTPHGILYARSWNGQLISCQSKQCPSLPDNSALYDHIVQCSKPLSLPRTMDGGIDAMRTILTGLTVNVGHEKRLSWRVSRDQNWLYGTMNGGFAYKPGAFLRLYPNLRRSQYPMFMQKILLELASLGVHAEAKVGLHRNRWDTYDGITVYLMPEELAQVLDVLWHIDVSAYVRPTSLKPSRQVVWRGKPLPVFLAQEPDQPNESFHGRLSIAIYNAMLQSIKHGSAYIAPLPGRGWQFYIMNSLQWEVALTEEFSLLGICPRRLYLNLNPSKTNLAVRQAIFKTLGSL